jgi:single-strand DNA-binding protein
MEECQVNLTGYVATQPETITFKSGASKVKMRVGWTERRRDRLTGEWVDGSTSYLTVFCWRKIGTNVAVSLRTGDPVLVKGKLTVRAYEDKEGVRRREVEVDASSIGHDLSRGVSKFLRVRPETGMTAAEYEAAKATGQLNAPAGNGTTPAAAGDRPPWAAAAASGGLRFAGGLEQAAEDETPAAELREPGEPDDWDSDQDDPEFDDAARSPEPADADEAGREGPAESEMAAAAV